MINSREALQPLVPSDHARWNESQFVWWFDQTAGLAGFHRLAHQPNRMNAHVWSCVVAASGHSFRRVDTEVPYESQFRANSVYRTEGLQLRHHGRGGLDIHSDYPGCLVELSIDDHFPAVNLSHQGDQYAQGAELREAHFEAAGDVRGAVTLEGASYQVDCLGYRDHSWGPRDLHNIQASMWATGTTSTTAFQFGKSVIRGNAPFVGGYLWREGNLQPVVDVDATVALEFDGVTQRNATAQVTTGDGIVHDISFGCPMGGVIVTLDTWIGFESASPMTVDGELGVGNFERSINPCGGTVVPDRAVHGIVTDGLTKTGQMGGGEIMLRKWDVANAMV